jgi:AcrR family transcriptional regulator
MASPSSSSGIYEFFESKKDLFCAVVVAHRQTMLGLPRPPGKDLAQELEAIFGADLSEEAERDRSAFVHMVVAESRSMPELDDVMHRLGFSEAVRLLSEWLDERRREKLLDFEDAVACAEILMHMALAPRMPPPGLAHSGRPPPSGKSKPWKDHLRFCIEVFLHGVRS